jgi:hypothetical protein
VTDLQHLALAIAIQPLHISSVSTQPTFMRPAILSATVSGKSPWNCSGPQGRLKVSHKADCGALRGLLFLVGLLLSLVQARVAF